MRIYDEGVCRKVNSDRVARDAFGALLRSAAHEANVSINSFVRDGLNAVLGLVKPKRKTPLFMRFAGTMSHDEAERMRKFNREASFSQVEPEMWK